MKVFLTALAVLFVLLTCINTIRSAFTGKKNRLSNTWLWVGILACSLMILFVVATAYMSQEKIPWTKLMVPSLFLVVLIDMWRRNKT